MRAPRGGRATISLVVALILMIAAFQVTAAASLGPRAVVHDGVLLAMTVDDLGNVHLVTGGNGDGFDYSTDSSGHWASRHIGGPAAVQPSIALSSGHVYIAYAKRDPRSFQGLGIRLVTNRTGSWVTHVITTDNARFPSLRMRDGRFSIAYLDAKGVRYVSDASGSIVNQRVWSRGASLDMTPENHPVSLALDRAGHPRIALERQKASGTPDGIAYARRVSGDWKLQRISSGNDMLDRVVVDGSGRAAIGYLHDGRFRVTTTSGSSKSTQTLPGSGFGSFTLDEHGRIDLVRTRESTDKVTLLRQTSAGWSSSTWSDPDPARPAVRADGGTIWIAYDRAADPAETILRIRR